ncbi:MAG TPA: TM2 domain-containing protein [Candidatus Paenibacillus intestinavium]|nr:TM2 domain-containing protein [Candidatus Paenibacillus intestinavium]
MNENRCPACGASNAINSTQCKYCGEAIVVQAAAQTAAAQAQQQPMYQQQQPFVQNIYHQPPPPQHPGQTLIVSTKSKVVAGILGILLGGLGIHKFYLGKIFQGILYLIFCWTYIPAIVGFIEGIIYLCTSDENFARKYGKRAYQPYQ